MELAKIMSALEQKFPVTQLSTAGAANIRNIYLLDRELDSFEPDVLYVGDFDQISPGAEVPPQTPLLLCGTVPREFTLSHGCLAFFPEDRLFALFNFAKDFLAEETMLVAQLSQYVVAAGRENDLQVIVDEASRIIGNPLILMDISYNIMALSEGYPIEGSPFENSIVDGQFTDEWLLFALEADKVEAERKQRGEYVGYPDNEPYFSSCLRREHPVLCCKLYANNKNLGYLISHSCNTPFTDRHTAQLAVISNVVASTIEGRFGLKNMGSAQEKLLADILEAESPKEIEGLFYKFSYLAAGQIPDKMCAVVLDPDGDARQNIVPYLRLRLKALLPQALVAYSGHHLVAVIPINAEAPTLSPADTTALEELAVQDGVRAGISNPCTDIRQLPQAVLQATRALEYGSRYEKFSHLSWYCDNVFFEMLTACQNKLPLSNMTHPVLELLSDYDQAHGTDLHHTLQVYLLNNKNIYRCTDLLHLSRSSLYYRLNRIKELTGADIDDSDMAFDLLCSFKTEEFARRNVR
ncbi:helix-turn-helix domain-containing protein [Adlercreutzia sp. R7]|uniref:Helix-turn-helix domain-containing protein n=1 Tax=Adlercreutzia wanghongyangiae TaxID=3111451 RepID=A0ABU6IKK8_9ACTN|nr:helix-turn-helix domain-containing protein [Adlercreutzia sp. R7]